MPKTYLTNTKVKYILEDNPIYTGGEGAIYRVIAPGQKLVAKIYLSADKAKSFSGKIQFMVNNPPFTNAPQEHQDAIVWPLDLLFSNGQFAGYIMPLVENGITLYRLYQCGFPGQNDGFEWTKFDRSNTDALKLKMIVCYNLAMAVDLLHKSGKYVLVDMKPVNILIKPNGSISIIDLDSIQICQHNNLLFRCSAFTPEFAPPEFHNKKLDLQKDIVLVTYDYFSLSVIMYYVLLSIHPFMASPIRTSAEPWDNIGQELFVHGRKKGLLAVIPPPHKSFPDLPQNLQDLFMRALDHGSINPHFRPGADEWANTLLTEINSFVPGKYIVYKKLNTLSPLQGNNPKPGQTNGSQQGINKPATGRIHSKPGNNAAKIPFSPGIVKNKPGKASVKRGVFYFLKYPPGMKIGLKGALKISLILLTTIILIWTSIPFFSGKFNILIPRTQEEIYFSELSGRYYGFIEYGQGQKQVSYLNISNTQENDNRLALQFIPNVGEESVFAEADLDLENLTITSEILGSGFIGRNRDGKITLISKENNSLIWYFEK